MIKVVRYDDHMLVGYEEQGMKLEWPYAQSLPITLALCLMF